MSIIYTYISVAEGNRLALRDHSYFKQKLRDNCILSRILNKPFNRPLLHELLCLLDREPLHRRKSERLHRNSKVRVFALGKLVRIEHSNGRVMRWL